MAVVQIWLKGYLSMRNILMLFIFVSNLLYAKNDCQDVLSCMNTFQNNTSYLFDKYTDRPKEININKDNLKSEAINEVSKNKEAIDIINNFDKRPQYTITEDELSRGAKVIAHADDIAKGISNEYTDCKEIKRCIETLDNEVHYCSSESDYKEYKCERGRVVDVKIPERVNKQVRFTLRVTSKYSGVFHYNLRTQTITYNQQGSPVSTTQDKDINDITCENFRFSKIEQGYLSDTFNYNVSVDATFNNDCNNPVLTVSIDQLGNYQKYKYKTRGLYAVFNISSQSSPIVTDSLKGECPELNKRVEIGLCKPLADLCIEGVDTKIINGVPVKRDCWRYKTVYGCGRKEAINSCVSLQDKGCVQISSKCDDYNKGICVLSTKGYKCPINRCSDDTNIICGSNKIECVDGSCVEAAENTGSDFNDSISKISVINEAITTKPEEFTEDSRFIFSGKSLSCRKTGLGFLNCCKDSGWGVDLGLAKCSEEEKELGASKEKGVVIYVGDNVHDTGPLEPERVDKRYCVFNSKLARIMQSQGRLGQLQINFGSGKYPDCSGISPKMLSEIDMDKIDLSEIYQDISSKHKKYDDSSVKNKLKDRIQNYYERETKSYA